MADIGPLALKLTTNASSLDKGIAASMKRATKQLQSIGKVNIKTPRGLTGITSKLGGLKRTLGGIFAVGRGVAGGGLAGAFAVLPGPIGAAAAALLSFVRASSAAIDATAKLADRLGIATEALAGLQHLADLTGVSQGELTTAIERFQRSMGLTASAADALGDGIAGTDFASVASGSAAAARGLSSLGLSADQLQGLSLDQQLGVIADAMNRIPDPARRAVIQNQLFGRSGQRMGKLLEAGSAGIRSARAELERLGASVSRIEAAKVEGMNDSLTRLKRGISGLGNSITIAIAPLVKDVGDFFTSILSSMGPLIQQLLKGLNPVREVLRFIFQAGSAIVQALQPIFDALADAFIEIGDVVADAFGSDWWKDLGQWLKDVIVPAAKLFGAALKAVVSSAAALARWLFRIKSDQAEIARKFSEMQLTAAQFAAGGTPRPNAAAAFGAARAAGAFGAAPGVLPAALPRALAGGILDQQLHDAFANLQGSLTSAIDSLQGIDPVIGQIASLARSQAAIIQANQEAGRISQHQAEVLLGQLSTQRQQALVLQRQLAAMREHASALERASSIIVSTRSPLETFQAEVRRMSELLRTGMLTPGTFNLAVNQAFDRAAQTIGTLLPEQGPAALTRQSVEAVAAVNRFQRQGQLSPEERAAMILERLEIIQREQLRHAAAMAKVLTGVGGGGILAPAGFVAGGGIDPAAGAKIVGALGGGAAGGGGGAAAKIIGAVAGLAGVFGGFGAP